jgi:hypothetical protein
MADRKCLNKNLFAHISRHRSASKHNFFIKLHAFIGFAPPEIKPKADGTIRYRPALPSGPTGPTMGTDHEHQVSAIRVSV